MKKRGDLFTVARIPPATTQASSAKGIDDLAIVLSCEHFEKCMAGYSPSHPPKTHFCFQQFQHNKINPFDFSTLRGYFNQPNISCLVAYTFLTTLVKAFNADANVVRGNERTRNFGEQQCFLKVPSGVEHRKKIAYETPCQDIKYYMPSRRLLTFKNEGCGNLEEWVLDFGVRCLGRPTIRPCPPYTNAADPSHEIRAPLFTWWSDGWWKGILVGVSNGVIDSMQVYIPGKESPIKWLKDTSYPNTTLSWNIIGGSSMIEQETKEPATYFITVGNLNSEAVKVQLNFNIKAVINNTTQAYFKCSLRKHICSFNLLLLKENAIVLTSLGFEQAKADDD
ncbi:hypothetical protein Nepgr_008809 [Nepenthes gracilis]|uniref:E3 ubiquitin-protein ligase APD1-4 middle domain-containing protein n=1 Tax=Nepenthes gracilis TaxID=150966 RepID=A0AAD3SAA2_NEPGR|nr:hypothetical protein Nepgr_008809 [Nepenthes gracilis]